MVESIPEITAVATAGCICRSFPGRPEACDLRPGCPHNPGIPPGDPDRADAAMFHELRKRNPSAANIHWNNALDEASLQLRSKCPSLDEDGYVVEMAKVLEIIEGMKRP